MKEVIHHIPLIDLPEVYGGIYQQLDQGGILLTVTRPVIVHYPFFQAALEVWVKQTQAYTVDALVTYMKKTGFSVSEQIHHYPVQISKNQWFEMLRNRIWSTFSYFSDEELEAGITELMTKYAQTDTLTFKEELIFIQVVKR